MEWKRSKICVNGICLIYCVIESHKIIFPKEGTPYNSVCKYKNLSKTELFPLCTDFVFSGFTVLSKGLRLASDQTFLLSQNLRSFAQSKQNCLVVGIIIAQYHSTECTIKF